MLDSSEKPRMDGGAMQAIPMWSLSLGPARLCAPSCEHLFLPSQWWSEPLKQTDCGSNGMSHCKLDSHIGNRKCPTQICFKRPWICMTIIVHVGIYLLSLWNGGKISKQPKAFWSSFYLNISWNRDAHQKHQENCVMHQSLPTALQMLDHFLVRKPFGNYIKCISNTISLSGQPFRTKIWLTNCGLIWKGTVWRSYEISQLHEKLKRLAILKKSTVANSNLKQSKVIYFHSLQLPKPPNNNCNEMR